LLPNFQWEKKERNPFDYWRNSWLWAKIKDPLVLKRTEFLKEMKIYELSIRKKGKLWNLTGMERNRNKGWWW